MSTLSRRNGQLQIKDSQGKLSVASGYKVTALPVGAQVVSATTSAITVRAGHGFAAGDKFIRSDGTRFTGTQTVSSVGATTLNMSGTGWAGLAAGDVLLNLGPDTGIATPNYDASPIAIYSDMDGTTLIADATVTTAADGQYGWWSKATGAWEVVRNSAGAAVDYLVGAIGGSEINVCDYGAVGDGTTDDSTRIQTCVTASSGMNGIATITFPDGTFIVNIGITDLDQCNLQLNRGTIIKAGSAISAVLSFGTTHCVTRRWIQGGFIDGNDLADDGILVAMHDNLTIRDVTVRNTLVNGIHGYVASGVGNRAELMLLNVVTYRSQGSIYAGSKGIYFQNNADAVIQDCVIRDYETGVFLDGGDVKVSNTHVWHNPAYGDCITAFQDSTGGNTFIGCTADTPTTYGFRAEWFDTSIIGCMVFNNADYGTNNQLYAVYCDSANPYVMVSNCLFYGADSSHNIKQDIFVTGGVYNYVYWYGNDTRLNVTTTNLGPTNPYFSNSRLNVITPNASTTAGNIYMTGIANSAEPAIFDVHGSAAATPTSYARLGGFGGGFAAGAKAAMLVYSDAVPMRLQVGGTNFLEMRTNGVARYYVTGTGAMQLVELSATPANPTSDTTVNMYMKGDKLVMHFRASTTDHFFYLDLTATTDQHWTYSATAP